MNDSLDTTNLISKWKSRDLIPFDQWIKEVAELASKTSIERAASEVGANPAEVEAVIRLSMLRDDELSLLALNPPPRTTWFILARMEFEEIKVSLDAIKNCPSGQPPSSVLQPNKELQIALSIEDKVKSLDEKVFKCLASRAKDFEILSESERKALYDFGKRRAKGQELSDKQATWAVNMLKAIIERGILENSQDSPCSGSFETVIRLFAK